MMILEEINDVEEFDCFLNEQIEKNRKHKFQILFLDHLGNEIKCEKVHVKHKRHNFVFGVCPNGHISMTNELACGEGEEAEKYWDFIKNLFNGTTLWWAWRVLEPEEGKWTFDQKVGKFGPMNRMVERAQKLNHFITAHAILYPHEDSNPSFLMNCNETEAVAYLERHVKKVASEYDTVVDYWHPVNEAYAEIQSVRKLRINEGLVYKWLKETAPNAGLVDNGGYTIDPDFYQKGILNAEKFGSKVDYLGIRGYFELYNSNALTFFKSLWNHYDYLTERYGKKLKFTEIGAVSEARKGSYLPWHVDKTIAPALGITNMEEYRENQPITEETQKEFLVRMYRMAFAHKNVYECTYWDLLDQYTWNQVKGGLIRDDFTPKPAYYALQDLIHHQWTTDEQLITSETGKCEFRGFDGEYEIIIKDKSFSVNLSTDNQTKVICVE
ncbi:MAG: endo-1,4-beta-xylanase [Oliverpabstia sp.]